MKRRVLHVFRCCIAAGRKATRRKKEGKKERERRGEGREKERDTFPRCLSYILDFSSLDFLRLSDESRVYSLRDPAIMQTFPRLLRSYSLSRFALLDAAANGRATFFYILSLASLFDAFTRSLSLN